MTPKRIRRKKAEKRNAQLQPTKQLKLVTPEVKNSVTKRRGFVESVPDAEQRINSASTQMFYKYLAAINNDFPDEMNPGAYAMGITRFEMSEFLKKMKKEGKTYGQAAAILEKKVENMPESLKDNK